MSTRQDSRQRREWAQTLWLALAPILGRVTVAIFFAIAAMFVFVTLAHEVDEGSTRRFDTTLLTFLQTHQSPGLRLLMRDASWLAGPVPQTTVLVLCILGFTLAGRFWPDGLTLVVALAALAFLFHEPHQAVLRLQSLVGSILPGSGAQETARQVLGQANVEKSVTTLIQTRGIAGAIGLLALIWASLQIFVNAAPAMNPAFEVEENRSWIKRCLLALGLLFGAGALSLLSLLPSSGPNLIRNLHIPWLGLPQDVPWYINTLFWLAALVINMSMFALIYRFLPNAPVTWRQALTGGCVGGVLWEAAKRGFAYYLTHFAHYDKVYGTLGGLIILVLWMYYTSMILLLGAEAASIHRDLQEAVPAPKRPAARQRPAAVPSSRRANV